MKKTKEEIFDAKVAPLLEQIQEICKKHDIGTLNAFQLSTHPKDGTKFSLSGHKSKDAVSQLNIAAQILSGSVSVMAVPAEQAVKLGLTNGIMELVKEHADTCPDCRMKILTAEANGTTLTIEDFQHSGEIEYEVLPTVTAEVEKEIEEEEEVEVPAVKATKPKKPRKPKKKEIVVSTMFTELMQQNGFQ